MGLKKMTSALSASKRAIGLMNADTEDPDAQEAEAIREDIRKIILVFTLLVDLALEIEDIEVDPDPIEGIILVMRAASSAVRQDISRETVLK